MTLNPADANFCRKCGTALRETAPATNFTADAKPARAELSPEEAAGERLKGERKTVTALFADIKGSTALMAGLDPEEARDIIDPALRHMIDSVHRYEGYVVQSTGDGIFALFGAPLAHEDHPQRALYAALEMRDALRDYARQQAPGLEVRIGVNTGEVVVRHIETSGRAEYTPIGHTANLAARMESVAPPGSIAIGEQTRSLVGGYFELRALGPSSVKGIVEPINAYEVVGLGTLRTHFELAARRGLTKFVGREREMGSMRHGLEHALSGHGQAVALVGEAGIGKSRLVHQFRSFLPPQCKVLEARSDLPCNASPFQPLIALLREYFGLEASNDAAQAREKIRTRLTSLEAALGDTMPYLFALLGIPDAPDPLSGMDASVKRRRTLDALVRLIIRQSRNHPLVFIFEDLHWFDTESLEFLDLVVDAASDAHLLIITNYRPEHRPGWLGRSHCTEIRLQPLGLAGANLMLETMLGNGVELQALKRLIIDKTEGNPFFIEEIVQSLFERGILVRNGGVTLRTKISDIRVPTTVHALLASRIDRLTAADKELLQTAAVIGRNFALDLVQQVVAVTGAILRRQLIRLEASEFIYPDRADQGTAYTFKHALTQEVAYQSLLIQRRKVLHERIGGALETLLAQHLDAHFNDLAHHYRLSGNAPKAIEYLRCAADQARQRAAYPAAVQNLESALGLVQSLPVVQRDGLELSIRFELGNALAGIRGYAERSMAGNVKRARELWARLGPDTQLEAFSDIPGQVQTRRIPLPVEATIGSLWGISFNGGTMEDARNVLEELWSFAHRSGEQLALDHAHCAAGWTHMWMGDFIVARRHFEQSRCGHPSDWVPELGLQPFYVLGHFPLLLWVLGYAEQAARLLARGIEAAAQTDQPLAVAMAGIAELDLRSQLLRDHRGLHAKAIRMLNLTHDSGLAYFEGFATLRMGAALVLEGNEEQGFTLVRQALKSFRENGEAYALMVAVFGLTYCCLAARRPADGMAAIDDAIAEVQARGRRVYEAEFHRLRGEFLLMQDSSHQAQAGSCFRRAIETAQNQKAKSWELRATMSLARLLRDNNRRDEARAMLTEIYNWFTEGFDTTDLKDAKALLEQLNG